MRKIDLGQTITILANVGVIVGIIFLAVEVGQNRASLDEANVIGRATAYSSAIGLFTEWRSHFKDSEELSDLWLRGSAGEELTGVDAFLFDNTCQDIIAALATAYRSLDSLGDHKGARGAAANTRRMLDQRPGVRLWWDTNRRWFLEDWGLQDFVAAVENMEASESD